MKRKSPFALSEVEPKRVWNAPGSSIPFALSAQPQAAQSKGLGQRWRAQHERLGACVAESRSLIS